MNNNDKKTPFIFSLFNTGITVTENKRALLSLLKEKNLPYKNSFSMTLFSFMALDLPSPFHAMITSRGNKIQAISIDYDFQEGQTPLEKEEIFGKILYALKKDFGEPYFYRQAKGGSHRQHCFKKNGQKLDIYFDSVGETGNKEEVDYPYGRVTVLTFLEDAFLDPYNIWLSLTPWFIGGLLFGSGIYLTFDKSNLSNPLVFYPFFLLSGLIWGLLCFLISNAFTNPKGIFYNPRLEYNLLKEDEDQTKDALFVASLNILHEKKRKSSLQRGNIHLYYNRIDIITFKGKKKDTKSYLFEEGLKLQRIEMNHYQITTNNNTVNFFFYEPEQDYLFLDKIKESNLMIEFENRYIENDPFCKLD